MTLRPDRDSPGNFRRPVRSRSAARIALIRRFSFLLAALAALGPVGLRAAEPGASPTPDPATVVVAHYNVQNYLVMDRYLRDERRTAAAPKPEKSIAALIAVITQANPDLLHLTEMGPPDHSGGGRQVHGLRGFRQGLRPGALRSPRPRAEPGRSTVRQTTEGCPQGCPAEGRRGSQCLTDNPGSGEVRPRG